MQPGGALKPTRVFSLNAGDPCEQLRIICTQVQMLVSNVIMELVIHKATKWSMEASVFDLINCITDVFPFVRNVSGKSSLMECVSVWCVSVVCVCRVCVCTPPFH